jgi:hypothetical protein
VGGDFKETDYRKGASGHWSDVGTISALGELDREIATSIFLRGDFEAEVDIVIPIIHFSATNVALR